MRKETFASNPMALNNDVTKLLDFKHTSYD